MNKVLLGILAAVAVVPATVALACSSDGKNGIFPENNVNIPVGQFAIYSTSQTEFFNAVNKMKRFYTPQFAARGQTYEIHADWEDGKVNAYTKLEGNAATLYMFGGLARHPNVTADGFMIVLCHETGHHLGGGPKSRLDSQLRWASNEGQSDYFATLKCAREIWADEDNVTIVSRLEIPAPVTERCQKAFDQPEEIAICKRAALAGKSLGDTIGNLNQTGDTQFDKPDTTVVTEMDDKHPAAQCRLDTYFAGAVCNKPKSTALSKDDPTVGTCSQEKGETLGIRPLCWYLPFDSTTTPPPRPRGSSWPSSRARHSVSR